MFLETHRLILRRFRDADFDDFCEFAMDAEVSRMMGRTPLKTWEEAWAAFNWVKERELRGYALELKSSGRVIGSLTVTRVPQFSVMQRALAGQQGRSLTFAIAPGYRRQGLMEEALRAVIRALFAEGMDFVHCGSFEFNKASAALQKKLGFEYLTTERIDVDGETHTAIERILWK